jgi:hypothetical protein
MDDQQGRRGDRKGQAVERKPTGVAEQRADRAAGRAPLDAGSGRPMADPDHGRMERPDVGASRGPGKDRQGLADSDDREPEDRD